MTWATIWQGAIEALAAVARLTDHLDMFLSLSLYCLSSVTLRASVSISKLPCGAQLRIDYPSYPLTHPNSESPNYTEPKPPRVERRFAFWSYARRRV